MENVVLTVHLILAVLLIGVASSFLVRTTAGVDPATEAAYLEVAPLNQAELTLSTPINFLDVTPENNTFTVAIPVPSGVTNVTRVENATVTFNLNGYKETSVLTSNISVINVPEGMEAELST